MAVGCTRQDRPLAAQRDQNFEASGEVEDHQARDHKTHARLTAIELVAPTPLQPLGDSSM